MKVYRTLIDNAKCQSGGHEHDFEFDISGLTTARDLKGHTWVTAVEYNDPVKYSQVSPSFTKSSAHPAALFPTCPMLTQHNTWESWTGAPSGAPFASSRGTRVSATTDAAPTLPIVARRLWEL